MKRRGRGEWSVGARHDRRWLSSWRQRARSCLLRQNAERGRSHTRTLGARDGSKGDVDAMCEDELPMRGTWGDVAVGCEVGQEKGARAQPGAAKQVRSEEAASGTRSCTALTSKASLHLLLAPIMTDPRLRPKRAALNFLTCQESVACKRRGRSRAAAMQGARDERQSRGSVRRRGGACAKRPPTLLRSAPARTALLCRSCAAL